MRIRLQNELLLLNALVILLIVIVTLFPSNVLRIILGLPLALFFPGYTLVAALFPSKNALGGIERVALSFGLSVAVVPAIGLILNYTYWGIRLYPVLISLTIFILATSLIAWYRRRRLGQLDRFTISFNLSLPFWKAQSSVDKILSIILAVVVLGTFGTMAYVIAIPKVGERFTEFYVLGPEGKAEGYPAELTVGEKARVIVQIVNHEHEDISYRVEVTIDGMRNNEIGPVLLSHEEKWEKEVGFTAVKLGEKQEVEFILYKEGRPYRRLNLWVDVIR